MIAKDFANKDNKFADHAPMCTVGELFEVTFMPEDSYQKTKAKFVISNKSDTRIRDLLRWVGLAYVGRVQHIPRAVVRTLNEEQLCPEYTQMYHSYQDRLGDRQPATPVMWVDGISAWSIQRRSGPSGARDTSRVYSFTNRLYRDDRVGTKAEETNRPQISHSHGHDRSRWHDITT